MSRAAPPLRCSALDLERRDQAARGEFGPAPAEAGRPRDPDHGLQVAQPARTLLALGSSAYRVSSNLMWRWRISESVLARAPYVHAVHVRDAEGGEGATCAADEARLEQRGLHRDLALAISV